MSLFHVNKLVIIDVLIIILHLKNQMQFREKRLPESSYHWGTCYGLQSRDLAG